MIRTISKKRRVIQLIAFVLIIYGGILFKVQTNISWLPYVKSTPSFRVKERLSHLTTPSEDAGAFDVFLPIRSCSYARNTGLFRGSFLYFLSENITYRVPLWQFLPHVIFYLILIFFFGMLLCGWLCPLCYIQDLLAMIRRKLHIPQIKPPDSFRKSLNILAFIQLGLIIIIAFLITFPIFHWETRKQLFNLNSQLNPGDYIFPYLSGFNTSPLQIPVTNALSLILKIIMIGILLVLFASFFIKLSYCKMCPLGALNGLFNKGSLLSIEKDSSKCTYCGNCYLACPMQFKHIYNEKNNKNVDRTFCLRCFRCIDVCPEDSCLKVKFLNFTIFHSKSTKKLNSLSSKIKIYYKYIMDFLKPNSKNGANRLL